tara:strand:+ start:529 stop:771 length:243 start_codon:yes stop_codon:yes gene_type:complete
MIDNKITYKGTIEMFSGNKKSFSFGSNNLSMDKMDIMERAAKVCKVKVENVLDCIFMKVNDNPDGGCKRDEEGDVINENY